MFPAPGQQHLVGEGNTKAQFRVDLPGNNPVTPHKSTDEALLTQLCIACQQAYSEGEDLLGDEKFHELSTIYRSIAHAVCNTVFRSAGLRGSTEDAVQESLIAIWLQLRGQHFRTDLSFTPWANTITRRAAFSVIRKQNRRNLLTRIFSDRLPKTPTDESSSNSDLQQDLAQLDAILPPEERTLLHRRYIHNVSYPDLAKEYGTTPEAIRGRIYRIRDRVRKALPSTEN